MRPADRRVRISIFDFHINLTPLTEPARVRPDYAFLTTPERYQTAYAGTDVLQTAHQLVRPLRRALRRNHFWRRFSASIWEEDATAAWHRMLPFVCRPRSFDAAISYPAKSIHAPLRAASVLWPFGWSTILEAELAPELTLEDLRELSEALRAREPAAFNLNGKPYALGKVFEALSHGLARDIFTDPIPQDKLVVSRHFIMTIPALTESIGVTYGRPPGDGMIQIAAGDRARLHAALLGTGVSVPGVVGAETAQRFLLVPFRGAGFAITYFDRGSLLYLGEATAAGRTSSTLARCLSANVRTCSLVTTALMQAIAATEVIPQPVRPKLSGIAEDARRNLQQLQHNYTNAFCRKIFRAHPKLAAVLGPAPSPT